MADLQVEQVYHLAGKSIVGATRSDPLGCLRVNVMGTANVLEAARQCDRVRGVLCMESDKAYGDGPVPYAEGQALRPGSVYEASKSCVSHLVRAYHRAYGVRCFGVRSANVYGPGDRHLSRLVPGTVARVLAGGRPLVTEGAERFVREFIHVDDATALLEALMERGQWGESVNVGSGESMSVAEAVEAVCSAAGRPGLGYDVAPRPATMVEIPEQALDLSRLRELVGEASTKPRRFRDGVSEVVEAARRGQ